VQHFSGTIVETARFGLPSLPGGDSAALTWQTLVTGSHTLRVWVDGAQKQRLALLAQLSESDVIHNGRDLWTFASDSQSVGHTVLDATHDRSDRAARTAPEVSKELAARTPVGAAQQALDAIDPSTLVSVDRTQRVAGRAAYTLVLTPRDTRSTVHKVAIAIDAQQKLPLRVQVYGSAAKPAFEVGFSDISFSRPSSATFAFTPPRGARVSSDLFPLLASGRGAERSDTHAAKPVATTVGRGWTSVLVVKGGAAALSGGALARGDDAEASAAVDKLFTVQPDGSRLLQTALLNVLVTRDGTLAVGAVQPALLRAAVG
jgi:outer membrane lipoprotein-sorting protein